VAGADAELVSGAERFQSEYPGLGLVVHASSGAIVGANAEAGALLGLSWDQLVERTSRDLRWSAISEQGLPLIGDQHPAMRTLANGEPVADFVMGVLIPGQSRPARTSWLNICTYPLGGEVNATQQGGGCWVAIGGGGRVLRCLADASWAGCRRRVAGGLPVVG
ncbi:MAG: PAS domain-containing protein, partial [Actinomycetes bacterium]